MIARQRTVIHGLNQVAELELRMASAEPLAEPATDWANIEALLEAKQ
jgi:hypothetical protein